MEEHLTLKEGLDKFHEKNRAYFSNHEYSENGKEFIKCHDIAHVVFGCDTTIFGEGVVKIWTTFGTTLSFWKVTSGYQDASAFELFKGYSFKHVAKNILRFLGAIPKTIVRAKRMSKPWPFSDYEPYLDMKLSEIRNEFNIQILR